MPPELTQAVKLRYPLIWVLAHVVRLFSVIVGPFSRNVDRCHPIFAANLGRKSRCYRVLRFMFSGRNIYPLKYGGGAQDKSEDFAETP